MLLLTFIYIFFVSALENQKLHEKETKKENVAMSVQTRMKIRNDPPAQKK